MITERTLLLLSSQQPFVDALPNLGDRALFSGFLDLAERHGHCRILHAPWKPFPWLTRRALRHSGVAQTTLAHWAERVRGYRATRIGMEDRAARLLELPPVPWLARASGFARVVRRRTGAPWTAALRTRLPAHQGHTLLDMIAGADAALWCAGGIIADHLGGSLPGRMLEPYLALTEGKPVGLANYSIALAEAHNQELAQPVLQQATVHLIREPCSYTPLTDLGVPAERIIASVDSAFSNQVPGRLLPAEQAQQVAIMVRGDRVADLVAWAALVEELQRRYGVRVHYLHGCLKHDPPLRRALGRRCQLADDARPLDLAGLLTALARVGLLITDRYHGLVFAMQTGTPVIPIRSTTHKTDGLAALAGLPVLPPPVHGRLAPHRNAVAAVWEQRAALSAQALAFAHRAREQLERDYAELFERLWGNRVPAGPAPW